VRVARWRYIAGTLESQGRTTIRLCGAFQVVLDGAEVVPDSRQARLLLAYLVLNRDRAVDRRELMDVLWPQSAQVDRRASLRPLLSRLRRAGGGPDLIRGRRAVTLALPDDASVDVEEAVEATTAAERALADGDARTAFELAERAASISRRPLLPGDDAPWVDSKRLELDDLHGRALESVAAAGLAVGGGSALRAAERAARDLIERAPFSESNYRLLMQVHTARGDVAEAVLVYELLRQLLRDELGMTPGRHAQSLHRDLLAQAPDS
jgi:SARP family transcriptional regulator, regulator of embCAB operon